MYIVALYCRFSIALFLLVRVDAFKLKIDIDNKQMRYVHSNELTTIEIETAAENANLKKYTP